MVENVFDFFKAVVNPVVDLVAVKTPIAETRHALSKLSAQLIAKEEPSEGTTRKISLEQEANRCLADADSFLNFGRGLKDEWDGLTVLVDRKDGRGLAGRLDEFHGSLTVAGRRLQRLVDQLRSVESAAKRLLRELPASPASMPSSAVAAGKVLSLLCGVTPKCVASQLRAAEVAADEVEGDCFASYDRLGWIKRHAAKFVKHIAALEAVLKSSQELGKRAAMLDGYMENLQSEVKEFTESKIIKRKTQLMELSGGAPCVRCRM